MLEAHRLEDLPAIAPETCVYLLEQSGSWKRTYIQDMAKQVVMMRVRLPESFGTPAGRVFFALHEAWREYLRGNPP